MTHRGPNAQQSIRIDDATQMGHTRLSILDLDARSNQPYWSRDRRYVITFNGEIYNYRELSARHNISTRTSSDTEVLVELYAAYGARMLDWLNGMYAFVIYDTHTHSYFVARDRLGIKPLYIQEDKHGVIIASELAAILALRPNQTHDEFAIRQYRKLRTFLNNRTPYRNIKMFPAGVCRLNDKHVKYWHFPDGPQHPPDDDELRNLVESAVDYRCIADVSVGSYLSGGLDSSIVSALSGVSHTWVAGMPKKNEFFWANLVAQALGTEHRAITVTGDNFLASVYSMVRKRKEPLSVPNEVLLFLMTTAVKQENTVVLCGEGADELFAGYDRIFRWAHDAPSFDLRQFCEHYAYGSQPDIEVVEDAIAPFVNRGSAYDIVSAFFQISHLHGLLRRLDNATMLCSVEARVPFVDHRLVERLAGVPYEYKYSNGVVKAPIKRVFGHLLPREVVHREKIGFPVDLSSAFGSAAPGTTPFDKWFNFNLNSLGISTDAA